MAFLLLADGAAALAVPPCAGASSPQQLHRVHTISLSGSINGDDDWLGGGQSGTGGPSGNADDEIEDAQVFRKKGGSFRPHKPKDNRDKLLFDVTEITPPPTKLGVFRLEPSAACGDLISARVPVEGEPEKVEQAFVIKKVSYRYAYSQGGYRMVSKGAEVKQASRDSTEKFLKRMISGFDTDAAEDAGALDRAPAARERRRLTDEFE